MSDPTPQTFYSISEVARRAEITRDMCRYWVKLLGAKTMVLNGRRVVDNVTRDMIIRMAVGRCHDSRVSPSQAAKYVLESWAHFNLGLYPPRVVVGDRPVHEVLTDMCSGGDASDEQRLGEMRAEEDAKMSGVTPCMTGVRPENPMAKIGRAVGSLHVAMVEKVLAGQAINERCNAMPDAKIVVRIPMEALSDNERCSVCGVISPGRKENPLLMKPILDLYPMHSANVDDDEDDSYHPNLETKLPVRTTPWATEHRAVGPGWNDDNYWLRMMARNWRETMPFCFDDHALLHGCALDKIGM